MKNHYQTTTSYFSHKIICGIKLLVFMSWTCILFPCLSTSASETAPEKVYKVGISDWTGYTDSVKGFKDSMTRGGFVEGKNVIYMDKRSGLSPEKQREISQSFKEAGVDLVYSLTTPGTLIMKQIMPETTPIVFSIVTYPADAGLIESFDYSGNNLVGTSNYVDLTNYIKLLNIAVPQTRAMAIFRKNKEPNSKIQAANMIRLAKRQSIYVIDVPVESVDEAHDAALKLADQVDVFMTTTDTLMECGVEHALI